MNRKKNNRTKQLQRSKHRKDKSIARDREKYFIYENKIKSQNHITLIPIRKSLNQKRTRKMK